MASEPVEIPFAIRSDDGELRARLQATPDLSPLSDILPAARILDDATMGMEATCGRCIGGLLLARFLLAPASTLASIGYPGNARTGLARGREPRSTSTGRAAAEEAAPDYGGAFTRLTLPE